MMQQQQEGQGTENLANEAMGRSTFHFVGEDTPTGTWAKMERLGDQITASFCTYDTEDRCSYHVHFPCSIAQVRQALEEIESTGKPSAITWKYQNGQEAATLTFSPPKHGKVEVTGFGFASGSSHGSHYMNAPIGKVSLSELKKACR